MYVCVCVCEREGEKEREREMWCRNRGKMKKKNVGGWVVKKGRSRAQHVTELPLRERGVLHCIVTDIAGLKCAYACLVL